MHTKLRLFKLLLFLNSVMFGVELSYTINFVEAFLKTPIFVFVNRGVVGPFVGLVSQFLFGLLSDISFFKYGRRIPYIIVGNLFYGLGVVIMLTTGVAVLIVGANDPHNIESMSWPSSSVWPVVLIFVGVILAYVGLNAIQVVTRALTIDVLPFEQQLPSALVYILLVSLAQFFFHTCRLILMSSDVFTRLPSESSPPTLDVDQIFSMVFLSFSLLVTFFTSFLTIRHSAETVPLVQHPRRIFISQQLKESFKEIKITFFSLCATLFCGYSSFLIYTNIRDIVSTTHAKSFDCFDIVSSYSCEQLFPTLLSICFALSQIVLVIIFYATNRFPWYLLSVSQALSCVLFLVIAICETFNDFLYIDNTNQNLDTSVEHVLLCVGVIIMTFFAAVSNLQMFTFPFSLVRITFNTNRNGLKVAFLNMSIIIPQITWYAISFVVDHNLQVTKITEFFPDPFPNPLMFTFSIIILAMVGFIFALACSLLAVFFFQFQEFKTKAETSGTYVEFNES